ncbi:sodium-dependent nutrient amino acid transporter 1-like [Panulirus ornatus]|uniref:sodium-dependent nutrient amino acid transporter 1-like n=1 Tax=Panulirus ornatus TaxID=150431 RepID=UPI003A85EAA5
MISLPTSAPPQESVMVNKGAVNQAFEDEPVDGVPKDVHPRPSLTTHEAAEQPVREKWANPREFLLSCIAMTVGVGNVWRFPFVALENGGGAFLIPYILVLIFIGKPLYYLEFCLGQFASSGNVRMWELSPAFRGVGYGQALTNWAVSTFFVFVMALCIFYFFASFSSVLPWAVCGAWADETCVDASTNISLANDTRGLTTAAEDYFRNEVTKLDPLGFQNGVGLPEWRLSLCLLLSWVAVFLVQVKGVRSSGKTAYFTAIFPYVVLFVMLVRGVTLPGAYKGVLFFITPRWEKLLQPGVWYAAVQQAFFSLGLGFGMIIVLASYNTFRHDVYRDATIISFADTFTSLLAGFTTFSILGHLAELLGVEVSQVIKGGGTSLAFISYPDVLARFQYVPQVFSVLFFLMMFALGLGSATPYNSVTITIIMDQFPHLRTWKVTLGVCVVGFLVGNIYATPQGQHVLTLVNHYGGGVSIILLMVFEVVAIMWVYGIRKFIADIEFMLRRKTGLYWKICWGVVSPLFLSFVFVYSQLEAKPLTYGSYVFDTVAIGVGMSLSVSAVLLVPLVFLLEVKQRYADAPTLWEAVRNTFRPTPEWCPRDPTLRQEYQQFISSK